jgi:amidohydrolase
MTPVMGGEDFSAYLHHVSGAIIFIGAGNQEKGIIYPHHHPRFNIDEDALTDGLKVLVLISLGLLDSLYDQD